MTEVTFKSFAGLRNTLPAERLHSLPTRDNQTCDLTQAVNVDIDNSGQIARRVGTTQKVAGAAHSLWSVGDDCFYVQGSSLKRLNPDFSSVTLATGLTLDLPNNYAEANGRIYWSNGMQTGVIVDGANRSWGIAMPETAGLEAIGGTLPAGTYQVTLTYLRNDGQESGAGMAAQIALPDASGVRVSWDAPTDPTIYRVCVYISEPNGETMYRAGTAQVGGTADVTTLRSSLPLDTQWLDAPPAGQCLTTHKGRIFIAEGEFLYATAALGYEHCDRRDYLSIDGSTIRFVIGVEHGLYIGTEKMTYFAAGDRLDALVLTSLVESPGVSRSAVIADGFAVTGDQAMTGQQGALFATEMGIFFGREDGIATNLTYDRYRFPATASGAACFRSFATLSQYLLFMS